MKRAILLLCTVFLVLPPFADLRGQLRENIYVHTDRKKYIAGEDIWFSIYNTDRSAGYLSSGSLIAYLELINPYNSPVIQGRFELNGGTGEGCFAIPDSVSSGTYVFRAYTNHMKDYLPGNCFIQEIEIHNPFRDLVFIRKTVEPVSLSVLPDEGKDRLNFIIKADSLYGRREKVSLSLGASGEISRSLLAAARISVAVTYAGVPEYRSWKKYGTELISGECCREFENSGHILSGTVNRVPQQYPSGSFMSVRGKVAVPLCRYRHFRKVQLHSSSSSLKNLMYSPCCRSMILNMIGTLCYNAFRL